MKPENDNKEFLQIRDRYKRLRWEQRRIIVEYLSEQGFTISGRTGGRGISNYTSGRRFRVPYDLSNWLWIDVGKDGKSAMISLQTFEQDPNSKNYHVLMDRIGIFAFQDAASPRDSYRRMDATDIDLPMDEVKLRQLADLLTLALGEKQVEI